MNAVIKVTLYRVLIFFCLLHITGIKTYAEKRTPLWNVQNEFTKEGYGLKGPVYTATLKYVEPVIELGQVVRTNVRLRDSLVFDENGNIAKRINFSDYNKKYAYSIYPDSVEYTVVEGSRKPNHMSVGYRHDSSGRITEVRYYHDGTLNSRRVFEYTAGGFRSVYYHDRSKEDIYIKKGKDFTDTENDFPEAGKLDDEGRVISATMSIPFVANTTTYYTYDQNGNLVKEGYKTDLGNKVVGTLQRKESGYRYEYVYDQYGNWIEKRTYENGKLKNRYEQRDIVYKTPEEIIEEKKAAQEKVRLFELEMQKKGQAFADVFVRDRRHVFKECLLANADRYISKSVPVKTFSVNDDCYSFGFSDGEVVKDIKFERLDKHVNYNGGLDNLISDDLHIVLVPQYTQYGPKWYVVKYGEVADFDFDPNASTDWVKLYRDKYFTRNDISDEDIQQIWRAELNRQWSNSKCSSMDERCYYLKADSICVNELVDAYEKGFVSPSMSNKDLEVSSLEKYHKFKEDENRKNLCMIAFSACVFNDKGKPSADKIKKFIYDESGYYFKTKDNAEIRNSKFDTVLSGRDVNVYLSADQALALVLKRLYGDYYLFIVELDGDNVKSINYIEPKDVMKFTFPSYVEHNYNTGYS